MGFAGSPGLLPCLKRHRLFDTSREHHLEYIHGHWRGQGTADSDGLAKMSGSKPSRGL